MEYVVSRVAEQIVRVSAIHANLGLSVGVSSSFVGQFEASFKGVGLIRLTPDQPRGLDWYWEQLSKLVELLTFLFGAPARPDYLVVRPADTTEKSAVLRGTFYMEPCTFAAAHEFYMPCQKIGRLLDEVIEHWFDVYEKCDRLGAPCNLTISIFSAKQEWQHLEFLSLMQALEGFHRALLDGHILPSKDYKVIEKSIIASIPSYVPEALKDALRDKLRHGHEKPLAKRLDELADRLSLNIRQIIFGTDYQVPRQLKGTRNYYTYIGPIKS